MNTSKTLEPTHGYIEDRASSDRTTEHISSYKQYIECEHRHFISFAIRNRCRIGPKGAEIYFDLFHQNVFKGLWPNPITPQIRVCYHIFDYRLKTKNCASRGRTLWLAFVVRTLFCWYLTVRLQILCGRNTNNRIYTF